MNELIGKTNQIKRFRLSLKGTVQGMGFRPFIHRKASRLGLSGWVCNTSEGLLIEIEGPLPQLNSFIDHFSENQPAHSTLEKMEMTLLAPRGYKNFTILPSKKGQSTSGILPDIAVCRECLEEMFNPNDRRYQFPFTTCSLCGPRFSIIEGTPFDREKTTMKIFKMCKNCEREYENPKDRRFHAQTISCRECGPHLELWDQEGKKINEFHPALLQATKAIRKGKIVALKGLGGFHLIANATLEKSLHRLRRKKNRPEKPFAIMAPDLGWVKILCEVSEEEKKILQSPESPIVLLQYREPLKSSPVAPSVAPGLTTLGIMLPYTPLHHLFLKELGLPVVATSGNLSDEPLCIDEHETIKRLNPIADLFLVHNRPIARQLDDSLVRFVNNRLMILRRARGYTPVPIGLNKIISPTLSVGAHLKNTIALSSGNQVFISQHIGDLNSALSFHSFRKTISDFKRLFNIIPEKIVSDAHPNYTSTQYAQETELPNESVQHHYAHVLSCMAEHQLESPLLGVSWDGTGFGLDGTIWGGEFLQIHENSFSRVAHFRNFPLPGGEKAIREPRRSALGLLYEVFGTSLFENTDSPFLKSFLPSELKVFQKMLSQKLNSPYTCSVGRLFDAIAAIIGIRNKTSYEGQAAMELEVASENAQCMESYPFQINVGKTKNDGILIVDWGPMVSKILKEISSRKSKGTISSKFHNTLVEIIIQVTKQVGEKRVILTGGCFQNKTLTEKATARLTQEGLIPYWNQQVPPNDGGISLGQIIAASRKTGER